MLAWENSGFSLDAAVRVGAHDRAGLERLLRWRRCALMTRSKTYSTTLAALGSRSKC